MKKIDLHIHTIVSGQDAHFVFDITKFQKYIDDHSIDIIAVTNHNLFDLPQFQDLVQNLQNITIFPGIEIDLEGGHLLLISDNTHLEEFNQKCGLINNTFQTNGKISLDELRTIFVDLNKYLLIPHYGKKPKISQSIIDSLNTNVFAGEVSSPKKFNRLVKDENALTPVLFSDCRISTNLDIDSLQGKQTFIKTGATTLTIDTVKSALRDKNKVFLNDGGKHGFFQVFNNGQELSSGLNVVLGGRSSGKTFLLDKLGKIFDTEEKSIKYIKQFDLVRDSDKEFNKRVEKDKSAVREDFLKEFRSLVEDAIQIDRRSTNYKLEKYIETLLEFASSEKLQDEFSNALLFKETIYQIRKNQEEELKCLLEAIVLLRSNKTHKTIINNYIPEDNLKGLFDDLTKQYKQQIDIRLKKEWVNKLIKETRKELEGKTSSPKIADDEIDFYKIKLERQRIKKFSAIVNSLKKEREVKKTEAFGKFKIKAIASPYIGAQGMHDECGKQVSFANVFKKYNSPIAFLEELKTLEGLEKSELYRYFCRVTYQVLNEYEKMVSGGEMAEFNLLRVLQDARQYDMLLVDEPESSFDNLFLRKNVNKDIKDISKEMPVIVVTHNNTVGMLMEPDYILYTQRKILGGKDEYRIFSGSPGDKDFQTADKSEAINSYDTLMDTLEAGQEAYDTRKEIYNCFKK
jgi:hypothetical protein